MSRWRLLTLIIASAAAVYLVGTARVALWDRDEPRYAQTSRQTLQSGDWVVPRLYDEPRTAKPVFIYWCQAAVMKVLGETAFAARLPSVIAMTLTLIVVALAVWRVVGYRRAAWTTFVLATSGLVIAWSARVCLTDTVLLLWITIAQLCLYLIWRGYATWPVVIVMAIAVALAGLTKGPIVLGFVGMTMLGLWLLGWTVRRAAPSLPLPSGEGGGEGDEPAKSAPFDVRPHPALSRRERGKCAAKLAVGVAIVAAIVAPWLILLNQRAPKFLGDSVGHDVIRRVFEPLEHHSGPPGYYLMTIWGTFFPWSLFLPMALVLGWRHRRLPAVRFALAAVIGPWVLFEFVQTKLPHYLLPCFVPLSFLTADGIVRCLRGQYADLKTPAFRLGAHVWAIAVLVIGILPWLALKKFDGVPLGATVAWTLLALIYAAAVTILFHRQKFREGIIAIGIGMAAAMALAWGWYFPNSHYLRLPMCVAEILRRDGATASHAKVGDVEMIEFKEPSLAFYQGGTIREQSDRDYLIKTEPSHWPRWVVIREDVWRTTPENVKAQLEVVGSCRGLAYADKGRVWEVYVVRKRAQ